MTARPATSTSAPAESFRHAVETLLDVRPRAELELKELDAPSRLAPLAFSIAAEGPDGTTGRLVLLHDPVGQPAWEGTFRLVCYLEAELDAGHVGDELLHLVVWSWLTEALVDAGASHRVLGGTVTQACSMRFGDIAGPTRTDDIELRASWTPADDDLAPHAQAFCDLISVAAGLPPVGVTGLTQRNM